MYNNHKVLLYITMAGHYLRSCILMVIATPFQLHSDLTKERKNIRKDTVFSVSPMTLPPLFKLQSVWKLSSILHLPRRGLRSDAKKKKKRSLSWPRGAHYLVTNENETFALRGTPQAPSRDCCLPHSKERTHPLIDWREAGWELTLALNGLKYACTTFFFLHSPRGQMIYPPRMIYQAHSEPSCQG